MTVWDTLRVMRRRFGIVVLGLLLTLGLSGFIAAQPGVYYAKVQVTILAPELGTGYNAFTIATYPLIGVAGAVAEVVGSPANGAVQVPGTADLPGVGVRDGFSVRLPNIGGQWSVGYDGPYLDVQAVGPTPDVVHAHIDSAIAQINETLHQWQIEAGVDPEDFLRTQRSPATTVVEHSRGSPIRAIAGVVILGMGLTITVAMAVERRFGSVQDLSSVRHQRNVPRTERPE
jgi:hypothetical protein